MRLIKELLQLLLDNKYLFKDGLCQWSHELYKKEIIEHKEYLLIEDYIDNHPPLLYRLRKPFINNQYYWSQGDIKPRLKWINKHIKLNA